MPMPDVHMDLIWCIMILILTTSGCFYFVQGKPTGAIRDESSCCQNGGTCILNSFCVCPEHFTGRYCEDDIKRRDCDTIRHGTWMRSGCNACNCFNGKIYCIKEVYNDCASMLGASTNNTGFDPDDYSFLAPHHGPDTDEKEDPAYYYDEYYEYYYETVHKTITSRGSDIRTKISEIIQKVTIVVLISIIIHQS